MTNTIGAIVGVLLLGAASPLAGPMQSGSVQTGRLDARIGAAAPQRYRSVRDAKDWENPYLVIRRDGIEVIVKRLPSARQTVAAADLQRTLIGLPVSAWPYGRVAAVQEISIRAGDRSDDKPIAENLDTALAILKKLDVTVARWPS
jgi:hypothetical protein